MVKNYISMLSLLILVSLSGFIPTHHKHDNIYYLFSHGIADTHKQAYNYAKTYTLNGHIYANERYLFDNPFTLSTFDYPDATTKFWRVNFWNTSLGQDNEINALNNAYNNLLIKRHNKNNPPYIVLFGVSRGASTVINFLATYNPTRIKAIILESPFDHSETIVRNMLKKFNLHQSKHNQKMGQSLMAMIFKQHKKDGAQPINMINKIVSKDIPILIICSKEDTLVPWQSSENIYKALQKNGYHNTYLVVLEHGKHAQLLSGIDGALYHNAVQAFYQINGLPHNNESAFLGKKILISHFSHA